MKSKGLLLIGAGGHAKSCIEIIESLGDFFIAEVIGRESEIGRSILGRTVRYSDSNLVNLRNEYDYAFIAIGQIYSPATRKRIYSKMSELGFEFPTFISKGAQVSRYARIGAGSIVMNGVIVNADCKIGENVILNTGSIIEHDVLIENNCHVATNVTINGEAVIGEGTFIGSGSTVKNGIEIGENCFIGMGTRVINSIPSNSIVKANF